MLHSNYYFSISMDGLLKSFIGSKLTSWLQSTFNFHKKCMCSGFFCDKLFSKIPQYKILCTPDWLRHSLKSSFPGARPPFPFGIFECNLFQRGGLKVCSTKPLLLPLHILEEKPTKSCSLEFDRLFSTH